MKEIVKRLEPTGSVLRELFLKSGNQCAFPDCREVIMNHEGEYIGQLCHIEAASAGGERFNTLQTNEQRREVGNLMLMCYRHHIKTNDVALYPVATLKEMKRVHEAKFTDVVAKIRAKITDHTEESELNLPVNLSRLNRVLGWDQTPEELAENIPYIETFAARVKMLPIPTRELLAIAISRGKASGQMRRRIMLPPEELLHACDLSEVALRSHVNILKNRDVATVETEWDHDQDEVFIVYEPLSGWSIAETLQEFCAKTGTKVESFIVDLCFNQLDE